MQIIYKMYISWREIIKLQRNLKHDGIYVIIIWPGQFDTRRSDVQERCGREA